MQVRLTLSLHDYERFVIAKVYAPSGVGPDQHRTRATRQQVRRFALAAIRTAIQDRARELPARSRAVARRLETPADPPIETLSPLREEQRPLQFA